MVALLVAACGGSGTEQAATDEKDVELAPLCDDVEGPGSSVEGTLAPTENVEPILSGVLHTYASQHPDTFGGQWIDRARGTVVLAFTDNPAPHREAILALRPSPDDEPAILPPPTITATTTVAESGTVIDVVQVDRSEAELGSMQSQVSEDLAAAGVEAIGVSADLTLNRVSIDVVLADDETRQAVASVASTDATCVQGPTDPAPTIDPDNPPSLIPDATEDPLVACDSIPFRLSALKGPTGAEQADDPAAEALREAIGGAPPQMLPAEGWRLLASESDQVLCANGEPPELIFAVVTREGDRWIYSGMAPHSCETRAPLPEGLGAAVWTLDPAYPAPAPTATELHLLVTEQACTGSSPIGERLVGPQIEETAGSVLVAFAVLPVESGMYTCPGNPPWPVTIELSEPLGDRTLADGTFIPPRPADTVEAAPVLCDAPDACPEPEGG